MIAIPKFKIKRLFDLVLMIALGWVLYQKIPLFMHGYKQEGMQLSEFHAIDLAGQAIPVLSRPDKTILIFWATWCQPCHMQLSMYKDAIQDGEVPSDKVLAISIGEDLATVAAFQEEQRYPFRVLALPDHHLPNQFSIQATPTTAFVEKGIVAYYTSGFSPFIIKRTKDFLADN